MAHTKEEQVVAVFRRTSGAVTRGLLTGVEFINRVIDEFASIDRVYPEIIPALWALIPNFIREEFVATIRRAAAPEFRYRAFHFGGSLRMTDEEIQKDADLRTERVQAWAVAFVRYFTEMKV